MKVCYEKSFAYQVEQKIEALPSSVILRSDVSYLGNDRRVSYALNKLIQQKKITRIGYGIYIKTRPSEIAKNRAIPRGIMGFDNITRQMLDRLEIPWLESEAEEAYNTGKSTQIPVRSILRLKKRFRRNVAFNDLKFIYKMVS